MEEAFGLGVTNMSPKVSLGVCFEMGPKFPYVFRLLTKFCEMRTRTLRPCVKEVEIGRGWGSLGLHRYVFVVKYSFNIMVILVQQIFPWRTWYW